MYIYRFYLFYFIELNSYFFEYWMYVGNRKRKIMVFNYK